jgi:hypothetical protein
MSQDYTRISAGLYDIRGSTSTLPFSVSYSEQALVSTYAGV